MPGREQASELETVRPYSSQEGNVNKGIIYGEFIKRPEPGRKRPRKQRLFLYEANRNIFYELTPSEYSGYSKTTSSFCYHLPAGTYTLHTFLWNKVDLVDTIIWTTERIFKDESATTVQRRVNNKEINHDDVSKLNVLQFTVTKGNVCYVGLWDFTDSKPRIIDNKKQLDEMYKRRQKYLFLDFKSAKISLPD
jgi:hypothetical protein